jgi:hypothetical protein
MIKTAVISASASGNTEVVAAVAGKRIRVLQYRLVCGGDVTVKFRSASTDITGGMPFATNGGISAGAPVQTPAGLLFEFQTAPGEALNINLSAAIAVGGHLTYQEVLV